MTATVSATTAKPPAAAPSAASEPPAFRFAARRIDARLRGRMVPTSWRPGCPVGLGALRHVRVTHWSFDGRRHDGELVVAADRVTDVRRIFAALFAEHFPVRRMRLVDDYGGDDHASIEADNTSAFNCRPATGEARWSEHAYGRAIDLHGRSRTWTGLGSGRG